MDKETTHSPLILLIENDENDVFLFRRALSKIDWQGDLRVVGSVSEARSYMENSFPFEERNYFRCPDLIVSDYRLNAHTALDFTRWLREHPECAGIPLVILTGQGSGLSPDVLSKMSVTGYVVKTPDVTRLAEILKDYLPR